MIQYFSKTIESKSNEPRRGILLVQGVCMSPCTPIVCYLGAPPLCGYAPPFRVSLGLLGPGLEPDTLGFGSRGIFFGGQTEAQSDPNRVPVCSLCLCLMSYMV